MLERIVTPLNNQLEMSVYLPSSYIGKEVHVLFYTDEDVEINGAIPSKLKKPSDYFGTLSAAEGEKMKTAIYKSREEWDRSI